MSVNLRGTAIVLLASIRRISLAVILLLVRSHSSGLFSEERLNDPRISVIHLTNGDYVTGTLVQAVNDDCLGWQSPVFTSPFQFSLGGVASVHFSPPATLPQPEGAYGIELAGGDLLFGSLIGLDSETAILDVSGIGRLNVDRAIIQRMYRRDGGSEQLFVGPSGLNGWKVFGEQNAWREDAGHLFTEKPGAVLSRNFALPKQARIEFELSWTVHPDFELAVGVGDDPKTAANAYHFEVWINDIVVQRETEREADVVRLQGATGKSGRMHVQAFLDQTLGRMLVFSSSGEPLADLTVASTEPSVFGGIQLTNRTGNIRLERLQIGRWNGEIPRTVEVDKSRIHSGDGTITYGALKSFDADRHEFVIGDGADSKRIPEVTVHDVFLSRSADVAPRPLRAIYLTGMKVSGDVVRVGEQRLWLKSPGIHEPIEVPFDAVQSLIVLKPKTEPAELPQRRGRLEINGTILNGCFIDGSEGETSCLVWQPARSITSSAIQRGVSGRIVYRDPPPPVQVNAAQEQMQQMQRAMPQRVPKMSPPRATAKRVGSVLHLRTGDMIPCEVVSIDEKDGVILKSTTTEATFIPHSQIKVLELVPDAARGTIAKLKKDRLLTLPRMQRDNPPTQLIRSVDGDYLRGRLISMDENQMQVELRLEGKIVRRDRVARIIWLHPEDLDPSAKGPGAAEGDAKLVQSLLSDGNRLTFIPEQISGSTLSGRSALLGACHVDLQQVDQVLMGTAIEKATSELAFHQWKLKPAAEPLAPKEGAEGSGDGGEGRESPLVGKPAPDISLAILEEQGIKFRLSDHQGKIVILDFWASWCGPCLQVMPQIDKVAKEFADQGVELYSINLEESPEKIRAALKRLNLSMPVLLDRDGRIAEKYGATSIPQTVIVNREGTVSRVFVGASARFDEQLRAAVKTVLTGESAKSE